MLFEHLLCAKHWAWHWGYKGQILAFKELKLFSGRWDVYGLLPETASTTWRQHGSK